MFDGNTLPFSPAFVVAAVGYAVVSAFITGPEIATREIARSDWERQCETSLAEELDATRDPARSVPNISGLSNMMCRQYPEMRSLCQLLSEPMEMIDQIENQKRAAEDARLRNAAAQSRDRCSCAEAVYIEEERVSLALYAASARVHQPLAISDREAALMRSLNGPACSFGMEGKR